MDNLLYVTYKSLCKYYNHLRYTGSVSQKEVDKLLFLIFLKKLMTEELSPFLTLQDYNSIEKALKCTKSCFIDLSVFNNCCKSGKSYSKESYAVNPLLVDYRHLLKNYFKNSDTSVSAYIDSGYVDDFYVE